MPKVKTLNEIAHLKESRFGRPEPRHGLMLLHWFANNCLSFHQYNMIAECDPESGEFGFHIFENRYERNGEKLLPEVYFPIQYYVVGNLAYAEADDLPYDVREYYTGLQDNSNMDRIIVSLDDEFFHKVYVTEHDGRRDYNPNATYCISKGLLKTIRSLELDDFLRRSGYRGDIHQCFLMQYEPRTAAYVTHVTPQVSPPRSQDYSIQIEPTPQSESDDDNEPTIRNRYKHTSRRCCECTIL
ncbi:uncharacterized protein [Hoplias malabaricus]|uniref:uncharacterized protein n=1 Tax=Hoplias malabaricus TaxID=27720 RepID=UPI0034635BCC